MQTKYISIVLDDGPLPFMCEIVDLFNQYNFKAGFAVMGERVTDDTQYMLKYAVDNGFQLVGHSHTHRKLETLSDEEIIKEMTQPITDIKNRIGYDMKNIAQMYCDNCYGFDDASKAVDKALSLTDSNGTILICGSFYIIERVVKELKNRL